MKPLTLKQREILEHIRRYRTTNGLSPSIRDLLKLTGLRSTATVHQHLHALERKGIIRIHGHRRKGITFLAEPDPLDGLARIVDRGLVR